MSFSIAAPYPTLDTAIVLPDPTFGDSQALTDEVALERSMNGTRFTYVKSKGRRNLQWSFRLTSNKALELEYFVKAFSSLEWYVTDHNSDVWTGYLMSNPVELSTDLRSAPAITPLLAGELVQVKFNFSGSLVSGS